MVDKRTYLVEPNEDKREVASFHFLSDILEDDFETVSPRGIDSYRGGDGGLVADTRSESKSLGKRLSEEGFVMVNTTGYNHALTYFFVRSLERENLYYCQADAHPDLWEKEQGYVDSSGFVCPMLNFSHVEGAFLIGITPNESLIPKSEYQASNINEVKRKLSFYLNQPLEDLKKEKSLDRRLVPIKKNWWRKFKYDLLGMEVSPQDYWSSVYDYIDNVFPELEGKEEFVPDNFTLKDRDCYVSIDLDVLNRFPTDWMGHGRWFKDILLDFLDKLSERSNVVAGDVCGFDYFSYRRNKDDGYSLGEETVDTFLEIYKGLKEIIHS